MRRWIKRIGMACLIPVVLVIFLSILLYIPAFQNFAVQTATRYAGETTGMEIHAGRIRLAFPLRLTVSDVQVIASADTLLVLDRLRVDIRLWPLLRQEVQVDAIDLQGVRLHTGEYIEGMSLEGTLGHFHAQADRIDLAKETARLNELRLSDTSLTLWLTDTTTQAEADSSKTSLNWTLSLDDITLEHIAFAMQIPHDSLRLATYIDKAKLTAGMVDLGKARYGAAAFRLAQSSFRYDTNDRAPTPGFDPSHIHLDSLNIQVDSLLYGGKEMRARLQTFTARDRSGLSLHALTGSIQGDSATLRVPNLRLQTGHSDMQLFANVDWSALESDPTGTLRTLLTAEVGKEDLFLLAGSLPDSLKQAFPSEKLKLTAGVEGNLTDLRLRQLKGQWANVFDLNVTGEVKEATDSLLRNGKLRYELQTHDLAFLLQTLPASERARYNLPPLHLKGEAQLQQQRYKATLSLRPKDEAGGVLLMAKYLPTDKSYAVALQIDSLHPTLFLPQDSLYYLSASLRAEGKGTDPFSPATQAELKGGITDIRYGSYALSDVRLAGELKENLLKFDLLSRYPLAEIDLSLNATLRKEKVEAMLIADVENFDLYRMHLLTDSLATSFQLFAEAQSDLGKNNRLDVSLGNWKLTTPTATFQPKMLTLHAASDPDTTRVSFHAGDFGIVLTGNADVETLANQFAQLGNTLTQQLEQDSSIHIPALRPLLPSMYMQITAGKDNPLHAILEQQQISFDQMTVTARTSPDEGLFLDADLVNLMQDTTRIDTVCFIARQDSLGIRYDTRIVKKPFRKQQPFTAGVNGHIRNTFADAELRYLNGKGETGILIGFRLGKEPDGFRLHLFPEHPVLAFRPFQLNPDNYILYRNLNDIAADVRLTGEENASLWIHSEAEGKRMEEIHAELSQINLQALSEGFPNLPALRGMLNANLQYAPSDSNFLVVADAYIDSLFYEGERVGELVFNGVYLPTDKQGHQIDAHFFRDRHEIAALNASYQTGQAERLSGTIQLTSLPFDMVNPFIPDGIARLKGALEGELTVEGTPSAPMVNGYLRMDSASVYATMVGSTFRFDTQNIPITNNQVRFNRYNIYATGENPFVINGSIDLQDLARMEADLQLTASNMQLLDVKQNRESMVYGKLFVNLNSTVKGPLDALTMRGDLQLLGGTNVTYVMQESTLTAQDRLAELVTFVDFSDTLINHHRLPETPLPIGGMDMLMTIRIDQAVRMNVDITPDQSSRIELEGGGDLSFQYTPQGEMILNGRYTLTGGMVKYAMPIIPLKEFIIQNGSYVQWNGDPMDPTLNLTATEQMRASVSQDDGSSRHVTFNVGVAIKQTLENLQLQFILSAPEDQAMQQELDRMDDGQRSQIAVTMLVSGMYLNISDVGNGGKKPSLDMGAALNSFLQSEINNIAGSALKSVDITLGMEQYDQNGTGNERTDFSFRFAKRFYNDRISIILGGRVSTGQDINAGQNQQFIDNVSIEYRLDNSGTRYIKLFHDKNYESLLEGEITETGAGIVLRKKMLHLRELFIFKKNRTKPVPLEQQKGEEK